MTPATTRISVLGSLEKCKKKLHIKIPDFGKCLDRSVSARVTTSHKSDMQYNFDKYTKNVKAPS